MDDLITCSVCLRKFDNPRVLPCQHTFCLRPCLEKLFDLNLRRIKCPLCRVDHFMTKGNVASLPKNLTIQSIIDMSKSQYSVTMMKCELCDIQVGSLTNCECCSRNVCRNCYNSHLEKTKTDMIMLNTKIKRQIQTNKDGLFGVLKQLSQVDDERNKLILSVNHTFNMLQMALNQRKTEIITEINKEFESDLHFLKTTKDNMEIDGAVLSSSCHSISDMLNRAQTSQGELFSLNMSIEETLPKMTESSQLKFTQSHHGEFCCDLEKIKAYLSEIGQIKWTKSNSVLTDTADKIMDTSLTDETSASSEIQEERFDRQRTYVLNRPAKCVSYEISVDRSDLQQSSTPQSIYSSKSVPLVIFGSKGCGEGEFVWPRGIAIDKNNDIIVADSSNHRLQYFTINGEFEKAISKISSNNDGDDVNCKFDCLSGVAVDANNNVICSDRYNHRVTLITGNGQLIAQMGLSDHVDGALSYPWGITVDSNENILVCDKDNHRIQVYSKDGSYIKSFGGHGRQSGFFDNPHYLALCPKSKNIFISDTSNHRIQVFDRNYAFLYKFSGDGPTKFHLKYPRGIAVDSEGNVIVCDTGNNRISVFTDQGKQIAMFGCHGSGDGQFKGLEGIAVFSNGRIVVSDRDNHRIQIF